MTDQGGRRARLVIGGGVAAALVVAGIAYATWFAPEGATRMSDDVAAAAAGSTLLGEGEWQGDAGHRVAGRLALHEGTDGHFLVFEDYEQTAGPDVYLYLSSDAGGDYDAGTVWKVLVPGGAGDGRSTLTGDFVVPVPDHVDIDAVASAIVWCDRFGVPFGHAPLA